MITEASTAGIMADNTYATRYSFTNGKLTKPLVDWALKHNVKTASIVYQNFGPGVDAADTFERYFVAGGGKLLERVAVPFTARDFSAYVQRIRDTKPDALYVFMVGDSGPAFIRAAYQGGIQQSGITILANGDMVSDERLPGIGDDALGVISSNMYYQNYPSRLNTAFVKLFRAAWGANSEPPGQAAVAAYDMMHAIYNAVQAQPGTLSLDRTMAVLRSTKFESPRGPIAIDPQTRDIVQNVYPTHRASRRRDRQSAQRSGCTPACAIRTSIELPGSTFSNVLRALAAAATPRRGSKETPRCSSRNPWRTQ